MSDDNLDLAIQYFEFQLGRPIGEVRPEKLSGWRVVEILWPLNEVFRPHFHAIRTVGYDSRFEDAANAAIEAFTEQPQAGTWAALPASTWRVLLERHQQLLVVALANEAAKHPLTTVPTGLSDSALLPGLMLLLLHSMKLPWPPEDRSRTEFPSGPPPENLRLH